MSVGSYDEQPKPPAIRTIMRTTNVVICMNWVIIIVNSIFFSSLTDIYGGSLLGVRSPSGLSFYDWESTELIRRIEIQPKNVCIYSILLILLYWHVQ